jgi:hypothetical protein
MRAVLGHPPLEQVVLHSDEYKLGTKPKLIWELSVEIKRGNDIHQILRAEEPLREAIFRSKNPKNLPKAEI